MLLRVERLGGTASSKKKKSFWGGDESRKKATYVIQCFAAWLMNDAFSEGRKKPFSFFWGGVPLHLFFKSVIAYHSAFQRTLRWTAYHGILILSVTSNVFWTETGQTEGRQLL